MANFSVPKAEAEMTDNYSSELDGLIRSRQRVADHGEVFTPEWMVEDMLNLVEFEAERIDSRFLEPACGSGNFLKAVLIRKLRTVEARYKRSEFERRHYALFSLMNIYGIELLKDNAQECRENLLSVFVSFLSLPDLDIWSRAAANVLSANIIEGDALTLSNSVGGPIDFPEWGYLGRGKYQRRDFRYEALTQRSVFDKNKADRQHTLFGPEEINDLFVPMRSYATMTVEEIAK